MQRVAELVRNGELEQALVRMWVLAGQNNGNALNQWINSRGIPHLFEQTCKNLSCDIQSETGLTTHRIITAPLACVVALDGIVRSTYRSQPSVKIRTYQEEGAEYWLTPKLLAVPQTISMRRQSSNREAWFQHMVIIPKRTSQGIGVNLKDSGWGIWLRSKEILRQPTPRLGIWISHFQDTAKLELVFSPEGNFRAQGVESADVRLNSILDTLNRAAHERAVVLLMPELTVSLEARDHMKKWLDENRDHSLQLIVAGSFHECVGEVSSGNSNWFNTAEIWTARGEPLAIHKKLRPFGEATGGSENIHVGNEVTVLSSPFGLMTLLICKDFLDYHQSVQTLLQEVPVDWVLVPSYGDETTVRAHQRVAHMLATVGPGINIAVANQRNIEISPGNPCPGFSHPVGEMTPITCPNEGFLAWFPFSHS